MQVSSFSAVSFHQQNQGGKTPLEFATALHREQAARILSEVQAVGNTLLPANADDSYIHGCFFKALSKICSQQNIDIYDPSVRAKTDSPHSSFIASKLLRYKHSLSPAALSHIACSALLLML